MTFTFEDVRITDRGVLISGINQSGVYLSDLQLDRTGGASIPKSGDRVTVRKIGGSLVVLGTVVSGLEMQGALPGDFVIPGDRIMGAGIIRKFSGQYQGAGIRSVNHSLNLINIYSLIVGVVSLVDDTRINPPITPLDNNNILVNLSAEPAELYQVTVIG